MPVLQSNSLPKMRDNLVMPQSVPLRSAPWSRAPQESASVIIPRRTTPVRVPVPSMHHTTLGKKRSIRHPIIDLLPRGMSDLIYGISPRTVQIRCITQHAVTDNLGCQSIFFGIVEADFVVPNRRQKRNVLPEYSFGGRLLNETSIPNGRRPRALFPGLLNGLTSCTRSLAL